MWLTKRCEPSAKSIWPSKEACLLSKEDLSEDEKRFLAARLPSITESVFGVLDQQEDSDALGEAVCDSFPPMPDRSSRILGEFREHASTGTVRHNFWHILNAYPALLKNQAVSAVAKWLCGNRATQNVHTSLAQYIARLSAQRERTRFEVNRCLAALGVDYMFVKGTAIEILAPWYKHRSMCDIDVLVLNCKDPLVLVTELSKTANIMTLKTGMYGAKKSLSVGLIFRPDLTFVDLEINCLYIRSVYNSEHLALIWTRRCQLRLKEQEMNVPSREDAVLLLATHCLHHNHIKLRDVNDIYVLAFKDINNFDWMYTWQQTHRMGCDIVLDILLQKVGDLYGMRRLKSDVLKRCGQKKLIRWTVEYCLRNGRTYKSLGAVTETIYAVGVATDSDRVYAILVIIGDALLAQVKRQFPSVARVLKFVSWHCGAKREHGYRVPVTRQVLDINLTKYAGYLYTKLAEKDGILPKIGHIRQSGWHFFYNFNMGVIVLGPPGIFSVVSIDSSDDPSYYKLERMLKTIDGLMELTA